MSQNIVKVSYIIDSLKILKPTPYINQPITLQINRLALICYESSPEGIFAQTGVLLFVDMSTATLAVTEQLVQRVQIFKNVYKYYLQAQFHY